MITLTIDKLREQVRGDVITADDERYDEARKVRNGMIDKRPQVIVRARGRTGSCDPGRRAQRAWLRNG